MFYLTAGLLLIASFEHARKDRGIRGVSLGLDIRLDCTAWLQLFGHFLYDTSRGIAKEPISHNPYLSSSASKVGTTSSSFPYSNFCTNYVSSLLSAKIIDYNH